MIFRETPAKDVQKSCAICTVKFLIDSGPLFFDLNGELWITLFTLSYFGIFSYQNQYNGSRLFTVLAGALSHLLMSHRRTPTKVAPPPQCDPNHIFHLQLDVSSPTGWKRCRLAPDKRSSDSSICCQCWHHVAQFGCIRNRLDLSGTFAYSFWESMSITCIQSMPLAHFHFFFLTSF